MKNELEPKFVHNIQVFLSFANFYWRFIQDFSKLVGPLTSMLRISATSIVSLIDVEGNNEVGGDEGGGNKTTLLNLFAFKKSTRMGYLTSKGTK